MENILIVLAEQIFRGTCTNLGYDLKREDECGILDENFFRFLVFASRMIADQENVQPADALETYAIGFARSEEIRKEFIEAYTQWLIQEIAKLAETEESEA